MDSAPSPEVIEKTLNEADVASQWNILRGDCSVVAVAIQRVFGGTLQAISSVPDEEYFDHVVVRIDGCLYDGRGGVSAAAVEDQFVPQGNWDGTESHWFNVEDITDDRMYNEQAADEIAATLQTARETVMKRLDEP